MRPPILPNQALHVYVPVAYITYGFIYIINLLLTACRVSVQRNRNCATQLLPADSISSQLLISSAAAC